MKILITGISGFIGKALAKELTLKNFSVVGTDSQDFLMDAVEYVKGDVLDKALLNRLFKDVDVVVHLAAITAHNIIVNEPELTRKINLEGTRNVLDAFLKSNASKFIYASTGKVYGRPEYLPYDEKHPSTPSNILGKSKKEVEELIKSFSEKSDKSFVIMRMFQVYGPGQSKQFVIPAILEQIDSGILNLGDVESKRDYIYIDDVVSGFVCVITSDLHGLETFNVGMGIGTSVKEIVKVFENFTQKELKIKIDPSKLRKDEWSEERADISKLEKLGWKPKIFLDEGIRRISECKQYY